MKREYRITDVLSEAFELMNSNWLPFIVVSGVLWIVPTLISSLNGTAAALSGLQFDNIDNAMNVLKELCVNEWPERVIEQILMLFGTVIISKMTLDGIGGKKVDLDACNMPLMTYVKFFATYFVVVLLMVIGFALFVIPGIYLAVKLIFAPYYVLDKNMSVVESIKASWADTKDNWWNLLGAAILTQLVAAVGYLLCCLGQIYTMPVAHIAVVMLYAMFTSHRAGAETQMSE